MFEDLFTYLLVWGSSVLIKFGLLTTYDFFERFYMSLIKSRYWTPVCSGTVSHFFLVNWLCLCLSLMKRSPLCWYAQGPLPKTHRWILCWLWGGGTGSEQATITRRLHWQSVRDVHHGGLFWFFSHCEDKILERIILAEESFISAVASNNRSVGG